MKTYMKSLLSLLLLLCIGLNADAQQYRLYTLPNVWTSVSAGINTNASTFDNSNGGSANTGLRLPKRLSDGAALQASFSCATVTLAAVSFVLQGSVDGTNYNSVPGTTFNAVVPASASSANNTNVVYNTNFAASVFQQYQWVRLAGITNGNAADASSITLQLGFWE